MAVDRMTMRAMLASAFSEAQQASQPLLTKLTALRDAVTATLQQGEVISSHGAAGHTVSYHIGNTVINPQDAANVWQALIEILLHIKAQNPTWTDAQVYDAIMLRLVPWHRMGYDHAAVIRS